MEKDMQKFNPEDYNNVHKVVMRINDTTWFTMVKLYLDDGEYICPDALAALPKTRKETANAVYEKIKQTAYQDYLCTLWRASEPEPRRIIKKRAGKKLLQARAEREFTEFIDTFHDIDRAGQLLGRPNIMTDFLTGLIKLYVNIKGGTIIAAETTPEKRDV